MKYEYRIEVIRVGSFHTIH